MDSLADNTASEATARSARRPRGRRTPAGTGDAVQPESLPEPPVPVETPVDTTSTSEPGPEETPPGAQEQSGRPPRGRGRSRGPRRPGDRPARPADEAEGQPAAEAAVEPPPAPELPEVRVNRNGMALESGERREPREGRDRDRRENRFGSVAGGRTREQSLRRAQSDAQRGGALQPVRRDGPTSGGVEALIARQNVLFEEFAGQQAQALRDVQRAVGNLGRGGGGASGHLMALPKVAIFLDVPNLIYTAEQMGLRIHFGRLLDYLTEGRQLVRATAYAPITDDPATRFESQRFVAPVINHGYKIVSKPWKRFADGSMKANFDIELAVDILTMSDRLDVVVLLSGDGDFRRVCELVESKGVRVEVVAFAASTAQELRAVADQYTDLGTIMNIVGM